MRCIYRVQVKPYTISCRPEHLIQVGVIKLFPFSSFYLAVCSAAMNALETFPLGARALGNALEPFVMQYSVLPCRMLNLLFKLKK
jgi:hypothetical protein